MFVGRDLQAIGRFDGPPDLKGRVDPAAPDALPADLTRYSTAVLDLDEVGLHPVEELRRAGFHGRVVGFYSHVDEELGTRAEAAGIETYPRGRFWRELTQILDQAERPPGQGPKD